MSDNAAKQMTVQDNKPVSMVESDSLMQVIAKAASDPATDVGKLERLMGLYERITERNAKVAYMAAFTEMQEKLPVITERGEIKIGTGKPQRYATWEDLNDAIKPILHAHGFALSFRTGRDDNHIIVTGILSHKEGHSEETAIYLPADTSGSKNAVQAVGSSTSYGRRYTAISLLNITSRAPQDADDDGQSAMGNAKISDKQRDTILALADEAGVDVQKFTDYMKVDSVADIRVKDFTRALNALEKKRSGK